MPKLRKKKRIKGPTAVVAIESARADLGGTYRTLSAHAGVAYRSLMRWRGRQRQGKPLLALPGPKKVAPLELDGLLSGLLALAPGRHRTPGTGELYRRFQDQISRRVLGEVVDALRREYFHLQAALQRRISWIAPGLIWSVDDMEMALEELGLTVIGLPKAYWNQLRDLSSRHQFEPLVTATLASGDAVAARIRALCKAFGPPLFLKRDNHRNLNNAAVDAVLAELLIIPVNSPEYYAPYNGGIEQAQHEFQVALRAKVQGRKWPATEPAEALSLLQLYSEVVCHDLDHRRRPCLKGATACRKFEVGKHQRRFYYGRRQRREVFDEIRAMASLALAEARLTDRRAADAAWRLAVETWLRREGFITVSVAGKVLPYYP
jgi:hypothetical protein